MLRSNIYLIDVNPNNRYGLNHQLWCIVDALMIGEYASRDIMVSGMNTDYNNSYKTNLQNIIDIDLTNEKLKENGFIVQLLPYNIEIPWTRSAYINPVFNKFVNMDPANRFYDMIEALRTESHIRYVDLWTSFVWPVMFPYGNNDYLQQKAIKAFRCLVPSCMFRYIINNRSKQLTPEYDVVHLRLEDDWVNHITQALENNPHYGKSFEDCTRDIYENVTELIDKHLIDSENSIYIATGLNKDMDKNWHILSILSEKYPDRLVFNNDEKCEWSLIFPGSGVCREVDGYIDLNICMNGKRFIGSSMSSFSYSLRVCYENENKSSYLYNG